MKKKLTKDPGSKARKINPAPSPPPPHDSSSSPKFEHIHMPRLNVYRECTGAFVPALNNIAGSGIVGAEDVGTIPWE